MVWAPGGCNGDRWIHSLKLTAILPLKIGGPWISRRFLLESIFFRGELLVLGRVMPKNDMMMNNASFYELTNKPLEV